MISLSHEKGTSIHLLLRTKELLERANATLEKIGVDKANCDLFLDACD